MAISEVEYLDDKKMVFLALWIGALSCIKKRPDSHNHHLDSTVLNMPPFDRCHIRIRSLFLGVCDKGTFESFKHQKRYPVHGQVKLRKNPEKKNPKTRSEGDLNARPQDLQSHALPLILKI